MTCADLAGLVLWSFVTWLNTLLAHALTHATLGRLRELLTSYHIPMHSLPSRSDSRLPVRSWRPGGGAAAQPHLRSRTQDLFRNSGLLVLLVLPRAATRWRRAIKITLFGSQRKHHPTPHSTRMDQPTSRRASPPNSLPRSLPDSLPTKLPTNIRKYL